MVWFGVSVDFENERDKRTGWQLSVSSMHIDERGLVPVRLAWGTRTVDVSLTSHDIHAVRGLSDLGNPPNVLGISVALALRRATEAISMVPSVPSAQRVHDGSDTVTHISEHDDAC